jgi:hypothetical protein
MGLGLLAAWFFGYVTSRIEWPRLKGAIHGCYEIDHCDVPWWVVAIFILWFVGPALLYGSVAFVGIGKRWSSTRWLVTFSALLLITGCLYFSWYVSRAFG